MPQTLTIKGERFFLLDEHEYRRLASGTAEAAIANRDAAVPALEYARASLGRKIADAMRTAGLSQAELARRSGVRAETVNRIVKGRVTPDTSTLRKIDRALSSQKRKRA